jgi:hypothetical protein
MLPTPQTPGPNHGSVAVLIEGRTWLVDASILSGEPLDVTNPESAPTDGFPRVEWADRLPLVQWQAPMAPEGFPCRIDRIGASQDEWDALHERTAQWSPFNYTLTVRLMRGQTSIAYARGRRFEFTTSGKVEMQQLDRVGRDAFLTHEIGIAPNLVANLPDDREVPPRPAL